MKKVIFVLVTFLAMGYLSFRLGVWEAEYRLVPRGDALMKSGNLKYERVYTADTFVSEFGDEEVKAIALGEMDYREWDDGKRLWDWKQQRIGVFDLPDEGYKVAIIYAPYDPSETNLIVVKGDQWQGNRYDTLVAVGYEYLLDDWNYGLPGRLISSEGAIVFILD